MVQRQAANEQLLVRLGDGLYAVAMSWVREIVRVPQLTPVPLGPDALPGMANLRGQVVPVADMRALIGLPPRCPDNAARVLITNASGGLGLLVDAVHEATTLTEAALRGSEGVAGVASMPWLAGVYRQDDQLVQAVDLERLVDAADLDSRESAADTGERPRRLGESAAGREPAAERREFLGLQIGAQSFAVPLEQVVEILREPERTSPVTRGAYGAYGVTDWRGRSLPLVDLCEQFLLDGNATPGERRVVVVPVRGDRHERDAPVVGLLVDAVTEVLRLPAHQVDPLPGLLRDGAALAECSALARLEDGRLVSVIDVPALASSRDLAQRPEQLDADSDSAATEDTTRSLVVFELAGTDYAVPIAAVKEIVRPPDALTPVPRAPALIDGALNLRGSVLPVVGLRRHLGLGAPDVTEDTRVLVLRRETAWLGFMVDSVRRVERVGADSMAAAPPESSRHIELLPEVVLEGEAGSLMLVLDPHALGARVEAATEEAAMAQAETEPAC